LVQEIFEKRGCRPPSETTLRDHIQKCIKIFGARLDRLNRGSA
jgi:hypothetical protein